MSLLMINTRIRLITVDVNYPAPDQMSSGWLFPYISPRLMVMLAWLTCCLRVAATHHCVYVTNTFQRVLTLQWAVRISSFFFLPKIHKSNTFLKSSRSFLTLLVFPFRLHALHKSLNSCQSIDCTQTVKWHTSGKWQPIDVIKVDSTALQTRSCSMQPWTSVS